MSQKTGFCSMTYGSDEMRSFAAPYQQLRHLGDRPQQQFPRLNGANAEALPGQTVILKNSLSSAAHRMSKLGGLDVIAPLGDSSESRW
jgi:hypothetical protein